MVTKAAGRQRRDLLMRNGRNNFLCGEKCVGLSVNGKTSSGWLRSELEVKYSLIPDNIIRAWPGRHFQPSSKSEYLDVVLFATFG